MAAKDQRIELLTCVVVVDVEVVWRRNSGGGDGGGVRWMVRIGAQRQELCLVKSCRAASV